MSGKQNNGGRTRLGIYTIAEVFDYTDASPINGQRVKFHGHLMHMRTTRLLNFKYNGIVCVACGTRGAFFAKEKYGEEAPHLNLYGFDKQGKPLLMTRDHIKPKSKGGMNNLYNLQTMCLKCNSNKGNEWGWKSKVLYFFRKMFKKNIGE